VKKTILALALLAGLTSFDFDAKAQTTTETFGSGGNTFSLDFQTIGNAGNAADTTGYGAVNYTYSIGTYDISQNQLNAATANGLQGVAGGAWIGDQPAANVSWFQAAAFVNFLDTNSGYSPAYNLTYSNSSYSMSLWTPTDAGYNSNNLYRNSLAKYVLPSENEWYKSAYYSWQTTSYNLYPTGNTLPTAVASGTDPNTADYNGVASQPASVYQAGGLSPYGTMGQGGNVFQWEESAYSGANTDPNTDRGIRGGFWHSNAGDLQSSSRNSDNPGDANGAVGFRVASVSAVPEPSTYALCILAGVIVLVAYKRRRAF